MIEIIRAPAYLALQDLGFRGHRDIGLPRSGAMDCHALSSGNQLVGNAAGDAALEWAVSGGSIRFTATATIALTGARVHGRLGQTMIQPNTPVHVSAGTVLEIDRFISGRFLYLCVSPPPATAPVFGSHSTYAPARVGGYKGRRLRAGDFVALGPPGEMAATVVHANPVNYSASTIRVVPGPQSEVLSGRLLAHLLGNRFEVSTSSDRTGYRLNGPAADTTGLSQILSEPACEGAVQITDGGTPIVLMADGPTIGGYNKVAVVLAADLPILAQKTAGELVRFALI